MSVRLSLRLSVCPHYHGGSHWTDFHDIFNVANF